MKRLHMKHLQRTLARQSTPGNGLCVNGGGINTQVALRCQRGAAVQLCQGEPCWLEDAAHKLIALQQRHNPRQAALAMKTCILVSPQSVHGLGTSIVAIIQQKIDSMTLSSHE